MPPRQCPECARFLKNDLVEGLRAGPAPCPKCEVELTAEMFGLDGGPAAGEAADAAPEQEPPAPPVPAASSRSASVRPPDLEPATVGGEARDVLAGWDLPGSAPAPDLDEGPMVGPLTVPEAATAAGVGALVGLLLGGRRRGPLALLLALLGVVAAAGARAAQGDR